MPVLLSLGSRVTAISINLANAAIASAILFSLFWLDPVLVPLGIAAAVLRAFGRTVVPAIALRAAALATMVFLAIG